MSDLLLRDIDQFRDLLSLWVYQLEIDVLGASPAQALDFAARFGRDKCRTPFQWSSQAHAGFCPAEANPWLPIHPNYSEGVNVADQEKDPGSLLNFYRSLLRLRRETPALIAGDYIPVCESSAEILAFIRSKPDLNPDCLVVLNMTAEPQIAVFDRLTTLVPGLGQPPRGRLLFSTHERKAVETDLQHVKLEPYEIWIAALE
jgi:alpha-glucosidase